MSSDSRKAFWLALWGPVLAAGIVLAIAIILLIMVSVLVIPYLIYSARTEVER